MTSCVLLGQGATLQGTRWAVPDKGLLIGRDPDSCDHCVPATATEVSREHVQVETARGATGIVLSDVGSKNGTWIAGPTRLEPDIPTFVPLGGEFWLGSRQWRFLVEAIDDP